MLIQRKPLRVLLAACLLAVWLPAQAQTAAAGATNRTVEIHDRIATTDSKSNRVALTLDACSGKFDEDVVQFLIRNRIPATFFVTAKWLRSNPRGVALLKANLDLFDIEDHGENHIPAVIGIGRKVYGIPGEPDVLHLRREVLEGAKAIEAVTGVPPHWYRGATAVYDQAASDEIRRMGFKIAGFSVNADAGATLDQRQIIDRLKRVKGGDVVIAHMKKPTGSTAEGLSVGLLDLLPRGLVFVRLDAVDLVEVK
jgi:peptidoglycan/xylan/chitin deacetylase (PgdA/CDA1 family)